MSELTLPGSIPGLLRRGSPVIALVGRARADTRGLCFGHGLDHTGTLIGTQREGVVWYGLGDVRLDLSDLTGRAHALLWLTTCDVAALESIADDMTGPIVDALYWAWAGWEDDTGAPLGWELNLWNARYFFLNDDLLVDLNHRDVDTLADGSRAVDAEALRRIVLHVAGREGSDV